MSSKTKTKRGRPATLTDSARKRYRKEVIARYAKSKINIGKEHNRWTSLKDSLNLGTHDITVYKTISLYRASAVISKNNFSNSL